MEAQLLLTLELVLLVVLLELEELEGLKRLVFVVMRQRLLLAVHNTLLVVLDDLEAVHFKVKLLAIELGIDGGFAREHNAVVIEFEIRIVFAASRELILRRR